MFRSAKRPQQHPPDQEHPLGRGPAAREQTGPVASGIPAAPSSQRRRQQHDGPGSKTGPLRNRGAGAPAGRVHEKTERPRREGEKRYGDSTPQPEDHEVRSNEFTGDCPSIPCIQIASSDPFDQHETIGGVVGPVDLEKIWGRFKQVEVFCQIKEILLETDFGKGKIQNFKLNWPHLRNFDDSVLKHATLSELTSMGKQRVSGSKILSQTLSRNFENIQNFPEKIPEGLDNCLGKAHQSRFLRGYAGDAQDLWLQGREAWGANGIEPMANYEVVSMGLGDGLTHKVWAEIHKSNSRALSIRLLSPKSVEEAWKETEKNESPREFDTMNDFKIAMATLEGGIHRVAPWNFAFKTLHLFMISMNYGENELNGKTNKPVFLANFVDEVLRCNARNWEEKKKFLSYQDLAVRWTANLTRSGGGGWGKRAKETGKKQGRAYQVQKITRMGVPAIQ